MYFQCPTDEDVDRWTEEMIWEELQKRLDGPDGFQLKRGRIFDKTLLRFRSYVCEPLRYGNLFLAGDAGHTVPPTGAKGLNLAFADVRVLFEASTPTTPPARRTSWTPTATARWNGSGRHRTSRTG